MKEISKMRLGLLTEVKKLIRYFENMEKGIKSRDPGRIYPAYCFISTLAYHMNEGDLTQLSIELKQALLHANYEDKE